MLALLPQNIAIGTPKRSSTIWRVMVDPGSTGCIGYYPARRGDVFIWGRRGYTSGAAGHTGIFYDDHDTIIHCNAGHNGISINPHDTIWSYNGSPAITIIVPGRRKRRRGYLSRS